MLEQEQDNIEALAGLARCYLKAGDVERARQIAEMIPEANRKHPSAIAIFASLDLVSHTSKPDETLELKTRVNNTPTDWDARFDLAGIYSAQEQARGSRRPAPRHPREELRAGRKAPPRSSCFKIFEAAGPKAEITKEGRRSASSGQASRVPS